MVREGFMAGAGRRHGLGRMQRALLLGVSAVSLSLAPGIAGAQTVVSGFDANQLARNDDQSTGAVPLPFTANYFGTSYGQIYVNNNGNVTFGQSSSNFTPVGLGAGYSGPPIIAPFFTDIDTRNAASGVTSYGNGTYAGQTAFGVTWPSVGYFSSRADKTNTFQLIMASRGDTGQGNFDIYFNYGRIQFETGDADGGVNGLGGTSASAGYSAGTGAAGTFYELPGSLTNGALIDGGPNSLVAGTNNGVPGQFLFPVRNGTVLLASVCAAGDNASTTTSAVCGPNRAYNQGIFYTPVNPFTLTVRENTTITAPAGADAILVMPTAATAGAVPTASTTVNVVAGATITSADRAGIQIDNGTTGTGQGTVDTAGTITAATAGIVAQTNTGALRVTNTGGITAPFGVLGQSASATLSNGGTITAGVGLAAIGPDGVPSAGSVANAGTITFGKVGLAAALGGGSLSNTGTLTYSGAIADPFSATVMGALPAAATIRTALQRVAGVVGRSDIPTTGMAGLAASDLMVSNAGTITGSAFGVAALSQQGRLTFQNTGTITATEAGVAAAGRTITFSNSGSIAAAGVAAQLTSAGGSLSVANSGTLSGLVGVRAGVMQPATGSTLTISNAAGGTITGTSGTAIDTSGSSVATQLDNRGTITGALALSTGSSVTNAGQFNAVGTSTLGGAAFNNLGTLSVVPGQTGPVNATVAGLSTFTNAGTISLVNGQAGDTLTIQGNYAGQNGRLLTEFSTQDKVGDRLVITGNATGTTGVTVTNLTSATPFTIGAPVVVVNGASDANAFTLTSTRGFGTLEPVLVTTRGQGEGSTVSLGIAVAAVPNAVALSAPAAVIASRTIAFQGGTAVLDRMTQLRTETQRAASGTPSIPQALQYAGLNQYAALVSKDPIAPKLVQPVEPPPSNVRPAVWARAYGDLERRTGSTSFSFAGTSFSRDLGYTQSGGGLLGGADLVISRLTSAEDGLIIGVMGGYTTAAVRLNQAAGRQDYEGGTVGVYGSYLNGPWFWDHLFKVDLLGLDIRAPGLLQRTGLQNYAYTTNVGYRIPLENAVYVEPTAGLEYVATTFDRQAALTPTSVPLRDGDALRGRIGARVGSEFVQGDIRVEPSVTGFLYSVLTESGTSGAVNGITGATGLREQGKLRGEVQASVNFFNLKTGLSGFVRADYRIGGDLVGGGGRVGVRYQW